MLKKSIPFVLIFAVLLLSIIGLYFLDKAFAEESVALEQVKSSIVSLIQQANYAEAQEQTQQLLTDFAEDEKIAETIWQIAAKYDDMQEYDKAFELNQYNVENFPDKIEAMWSQTEIIEHHIRNKNYSAVESEFNNLITIFAAQPMLAKEIWRVASMYDGVREYDKALEVNKYNIEHFPNDIHAMWSQVGTIYYYLRNKDYEGFDREFERLHTTFAKQETLSREIWNVAGTCDQAEEYDKALEVNRYNIEHFPDRIEAMWSQVGTIYYYLRNQDYNDFDREFEKLCTNFSGQETLPKEIWFIACTCDETEEYDKALEVNRYNIEHFPNDIHAMRSQVGTIYYYLRNKDYEGFDRELENLYTIFAGQPALAEEIHNVAKERDRQNHYEPNDLTKAVFQLVCDTFPQSPQAKRARLNISKMNIMSMINSGDDEGAFAEIYKLITDFNNCPDLPMAVSLIGEKYYANGLKMQNEGLETLAAVNYKKSILVREIIIEKLPYSDLIPRAYYFTGVLYSQYLGQYQKGIEYFQKLLGNYPDYQFASDAQFFIGLYYEILRNSGEISESEANPKIEEAYQAVVEQYPYSEPASHIALKLGRTYFEKEQWLQAVKYFEFFLNKFPDQLKAVVWPLGRSYEKMGQTEMASEIYHTFIELSDPCDPDVKTIKKRLETLASMHLSEEGQNK